MYFRLLFALLLFNSTIGSAQCDSNDFKRLFYLVNQGKVTPGEFTVAEGIVRKLETGKCHEYEIRQNGKAIGVASLTKVFATICVFGQSAQAVNAFVAYTERNIPDNEAFLPESWEILFESNPDLVLQTVTNVGVLPAYDPMEQLAKGFVQKRRNELNSDNYKETFLYSYTGLPDLYPRYQKQLDFLLETVRKQLQ